MSGLKPIAESTRADVFDESIAMLLAGIGSTFSLCTRTQAKANCGESR